MKKWGIFGLIIAIVWLPFAIIFELAKNYEKKR